MIMNYFLKIKSFNYVLISKAFYDFTVLMSSSQLDLLVYF
jgi:hypothetical protein